MIEMQGNTTMEDAASALCVVLAGQRSMRPGLSVAQDVGIPLAALPIDGECSLAEAWSRAITASGMAGPRQLAISDRGDERYFVRSGQPSGQDRDGGALVPVVDRAEHRGAAGTVGDLWSRARESETLAAGRTGQSAVGAAAGGVLVIECSSAPCFDLSGFRAFVEAQLTVADRPPWAVVGAAPSVAGGGERSPAGVFYLTERALRLIPHIGYFDLKEQLLAAITGAGGSVACWTGAPRFARIVGRASYLDAIRLRLDLGGVARAEDASLESGAMTRGASIVCRGAQVRERALVEDSAILPGAIVGKRAIVARSVVPPGAVVPDGALVVDQTFAAFSTASGGAR